MAVDVKGSSAILEPVIPNRLYVAQNWSAPSSGKSWRCFKTHKVLSYHSLCDDFGPMNMSSVIQFIQILDSELASHPTSQIVYCVESGRRALTNAVFLLGAYMILKLNTSAQDVSKCFGWLDLTIIEPFRDATFSPPDFELMLIDCWRGFERGKLNGWIRLPSKLPQVWGKINLDEYNQFENPNNADLHEVVPCKIVAFKGPKDLGDRDYFDDKRGFRHFSPSHYIKVFSTIGVSTVVRLNAPEYDEQVFTSNGIRFHDLIFDDCTSPSSSIVEAFFRIVDAAPGSVAVHCKAGLGRTGTLIALYMMRTYGFSAREAMGWLRIMRPGSVIGQQQHYLCEVERGVREVQQRLTARDVSPRAARAHFHAGPTPGGGGGGSAAPLPPAAAGGGYVLQQLQLLPVTPAQAAAAHAAAAAAAAAQAAHSPAALAEQVSGGMERRGAARLRPAPPAMAAAGPSVPLVLPAIKPSLLPAVR